MEDPILGGTLLAAIATIAGLLRRSKVPHEVALLFPLAVGTILGVLYSWSTSDPFTIISSALVGGAGATAAGRAAEAGIEKREDW